MKAIVSTALFVSALGCGSSRLMTEDFRVVPRDPPTGYGQVRFFNAITAYPPDIYIRDVQRPLIENLGYGFAEGYLELAAQPYALDVRPSGTSANNAPTYSQDVTLASQSRSTLFYVDSPRFYAVAGDLNRVDPGVLVVFNASASTLSFDFGADGSTEIPALAQFADARATLPTLQRYPVTVKADGDEILSAVQIPARPEIGDVVIVVMPDLTVKLLTYSFVVDDL
ncbi:MAG: DUF4397 domain-containing protein [Clostridia bacterium]|nr:DUF4397 domain-containing protein [Deltaproteobacteria bacterium]